MTNQARVPEDAVAPTSDEASIVRLSAGQLLLAYIAGTYGFSYYYLVAFLVPLRAAELGVPLPLIGVIVGIGGLVPAFLSVPAGAFADRFGARRTYILATAASGAVAFGFALAEPVLALLLLQLVFGIVRSAAWVASQTYITSIGAPSERAAITGRFSFATQVGTFVAPLVSGGIAQLVGVQASFWFLIGIAACYSALGLILPESQARPAGPSKPDLGIAGYGVAGGLLGIRGIQIAMLLTFIRIWHVSGWVPFFQLFLQANGFGPALIGTVLSASSVTSAIVTLTVDRLTRRASKEMITIAGLALGTLGFVIAPHVTSVPFVYLPGLFTGIGTGLGLPLLLAIMSESAPPGQRGVAMGLRTGANQLSNTIAPVALGVLISSFGIVLAFSLTAVFSWAVLGIAAWLYVGQRPRVKKPTGIQS